MNESNSILTIEEFKLLPNSAKIIIGEFFLSRDAEKFKNILEFLPAGNTRYGCLDVNVKFLSGCLLMGEEGIDIILNKLSNLIATKEITFPNSIKMPLANPIFLAIDANKISTALKLIKDSAGYSRNLDDNIFAALSPKLQDAIGIPPENRDDDDDNYNTTENQKPVNLSLGEILFADFYQQRDNMQELQNVLFEKFHNKFTNCKNIFTTDFLTSLYTIDSNDNVRLNTFKAYVNFLHKNNATVGLDDDFHLKFYLKNPLMQKVYLDLFGSKYINDILSRNQNGYRALNSIEITLEDKTLSNFKNLLLKYTPQILHKNHDSDLSTGGSVAMRILEKGGTEALKIFLNEADKANEDTSAKLISATAWIFENNAGRRKKGDLLAFCVANNHVDAALFLIEKYPSIDKTYAKAAVKYLTEKRVDEAGAANSVWDRIILNNITVQPAATTNTTESSTESAKPRKTRL